MKLFIDAAWRKRDGAASGDYPVLSAASADLPAATPRAAPWLTPAVGLALILAAGAWHVLHQMSEPLPSPPPLAPVTPAVAAVRNATPAIAPAIAPDSKTADLDRLATAAEQALLADNLEDAKRLTDAARAVDPNHVRVKFLNAQIAREQARVNARHSAAAAAAAAVSTPAPVIAASVTTAFNSPSSTPPASEARDPNSVAAVILHRVYSIDPEFPEIAREQDLSGYVDLEFTVRADGNVAAVTVLKAQPVGVFETSAVAAVSQWRYQPIERDGVAVDGHARLRLNFGYK